ncbi:glucosaminidase domain-containing protein [Alkaliphilus hydrothermalis]|uniref:Mannosyl-glycoprotein endo-beta-N-acetylglucosaminidase n=1 Tax=Alkaliphilus hydrothermalis TaxID=1482730 RepID=A0ABS2NRY7_9FIRM|nr:glucosaminidase domain-containing protein [Alkaliphilus hydrothermalis]MBM7615713.1 hypothetical protein [Alkaliphilus hydrothermalis]
MADFTKDLKESKVLIKEDVLRIREYILTKYPHYSPQSRAEVLANAIDGIVGKHLEGFSPYYRHRIQEQIFKGPLLKNPDGIFLLDVFEVSLILSLENKDEQFLYDLHNWVNGNIKSPIQLSEIITYQNNYQHSLHNESNALNINEEHIALDLHSQHALLEDETPLENSVTNHFNEIHPINVEVKETTNRNPVTSKCKLVAYNPKSIKKTPEKLSFPKGLLKSAKLHTYIAVSVLILFFAGRLMVSVSADEDTIPVLESPNNVVHSPAHLPLHFHYKEINGDKLKAYLTTRNSLLKEEPYFTAILDAAKEFGLNPLVLFAITGHEQGFVPKDHPAALKIVNNPFNVFHSWQDYNTDIGDSARIAARTVINLSKDRPDDMDAFQWINRKYAEDKNWWQGVKSIFNRLEKEVE